MSDRTDVVIYTQGWMIDRPAEGEPPLAQIKGRMFINGHEVPHFVSARILTSAADFLHLSVRFDASTCRIVPCKTLSDITTVLPEPKL